MDPKLLYLLGHLTDPGIVWDKLRNTFQKKPWANKLRLERKLYSMKLDNSTDLQSHLKRFVELFDKQAVIGDAVDEEDKVINLLASLPEGYSTIVTALESMDKVTTWAAVTERLLHEEKLRTSTVHTGKSLYVKNMFKSSKNVHCYECNQLGHFTGLEYKFECMAKM